MNKAFTLVELLVVVLIIGILTAVALPKYQTAVQKSRYAGLMPLAKSVKTAEEAIYMANGSYSDELADLSITLPGTVDGASVTNSDGTALTVTSTDTHNFVKATKTGLNNNYVMYFARSTNFPNGIHCEALKDDNTAKQICLSYGPVNTTPITGTDSNYDTYVLEGNTTDTGSGATSGGYNWSCGGNSCGAYNENDKLIAYRVCFDFDSNGNCTNYFDGQDYTYDEAGNATSIRRCSGFDSSGNCTGYSQGTESTFDDHGNALTERFCSSYSGSSCTSYSGGFNYNYTYDTNGDLTNSCWCPSSDGLTCDEEWECS